MRRITFDIESDGLLREMTVIHCITLLDRDSPDRVLMFNGGFYKDGSPAPRDGTIEEGLALLEQADELWGQNIIGFDIPGIQKLYPKWKPRGRVHDTKVYSSVIYTNLRERDSILLAKGKLPPEFTRKGFFGTHRLGAWGYRLGEYKGDFDPADYKDENGEPHTWKTVGFIPEMAAYALQDPVVTEKLAQLIESKKYSPECLELETRVAQIIFKQHERGFAIDMDRVNSLVHKLQVRHAEIAGDAAKVFAPWWAPVVAKGTAIHKPTRSRREWVPDPNGPVSRKVKGGTERGHYREFTAGAPFTKVKLLVFNPDSREHIADRLQKLRGWRPTTFTDKGKPQVDETILEALPWPEVRPLAEYLMVSKRLGQIANGNKAWLKFATKDGIYGSPGNVWRIHGSVNTNGAVSGRMTHDNPNTGQVPRVGTPYGEECRDCWIATPGMMLVGCDAEGLELRMLAHYMARYDDGAYVHTVVNGKKEDETDVHNVNKRAAGLNSRDSAKTFIYALIYGAGPYKLGSIIYDDFTDQQRDAFRAKYKTKGARTEGLKALGKERQKRLMKNLPALGKLLAAVKEAAKRGYLIGLDGRRIYVRSEHSALNALLQGGGAVVMKKALVILDDDLDVHYRAKGLPVHHVANVHDEFQMETNPEIADDTGKLAADCIRRAGEHFKLRCPLAGSYGIGRSWRETH